MVQTLEKYNADAILVKNPVNRRYLTGLETSAGYCLITKNNKYFLTDFRYIEVASKISDFTVIMAGNYNTLINEIIAKENIKSLAFESEYIDYETYLNFKEAFKINLIAVNNFFKDMRIIKTKDQVDYIQTAQKITERALEETLNFIKVGITEKEIKAELVYRMLKYGAEDVSFEPIVVSGANSSLPHGKASDKKIENGDFITMDIGSVYNGYCSDMTRTVAVGHVTDEMETVYNTVLKAQTTAMKHIKPNVKCCEIDLIARKTMGAMEKYFGHSYGHGVGMDIHEYPNLSSRSTEVLKEGHIVTAEPGIYIPEKFGVRIEDMVYVTKDGYLNLTSSQKNLIILG